MVAVSAAGVDWRGAARLHLGGAGLAAGSLTQSLTVQVKGMEMHVAQLPEWGRLTKHCPSPFKWEPGARHPIFSSAGFSLDLGPC